MILAHEQDVTEKYLFISEGSNGACKMNSYLNLPIYNHVTKIKI